MKASILDYQRKMEQVWDSLDHNKIDLLANDLQDAWEKKTNPYLFAGMVGVLLMPIIWQTISSTE
jgi:hypothetical protein